ncbi:UNVERIFIED_CONTAM: hypothetical protein GTU68_062696 [Idotea baltica]|nr:hypothetical protein [Idotea baltica]
MYIPKHFKGKNIEQAIEFIKRFSFGTLVSVLNGKPIATHLPFMVNYKEEKLILTTHFAKANEQQNTLNQNLLIIFSEPHAYISPSFYNKKQNVPTWNYIAVHVYGNAKVINKEADVLQMLESMILNYEESYKKQWDALNEQYKLKLTKGIIAINIEITDIQFKEKLSQNKQQNERENIIKNFANSNDTTEKLIAEYMNRPN